MILNKKKSNKLNVVFILLVLTVCSCKTDNVSIVGVWKPVTIVLPKNFPNENGMESLVNMTFEKSKGICYHFHADSSFSFESEKDIASLKDEKGTYSIHGKTITVNFNNMSQQSEIIKLTDSEIQIQLKDSITIIYEKVRNN